MTARMKAVVLDGDGRVGKASPHHEGYETSADG
jgi:hypothetical protein